MHHNYRFPVIHLFQFTSSENPFTAALKIFVEQQSQVCQNESAYIKPKEFSGVSSAKLKPNLGLVSMP